MKSKFSVDSCLMTAHTTNIMIHQFGQPKQASIREGKFKANQWLNPFSKRRRISSDLFNGLFIIYFLKGYLTEEMKKLPRPGVGMLFIRLRTLCALHPPKNGKKYFFLFWIEIGSGNELGLRCRFQYFLFWICMISIDFIIIFIFFNSHSITLNADIDDYFCGATRSYGFKMLLSSPNDLNKMSDYGLYGWSLKCHL